MWTVLAGHFLGGVSRGKKQKKQKNTQSLFETLSAVSIGPVRPIFFIFYLPGEHRRSLPRGRGGLRQRVVLWEARRPLEGVSRCPWE